jgi:ribulose 1,5-bisphosphate synthetase/thiazole synthase
MGSSFIRDRPRSSAPASTPAWAQALSRLIDAEVLILGAGPAGSLVALNLAPTRHVVLVERRVTTLLAPYLSFASSRRDRLSRVAS